MLPIIPTGLQIMLVAGSLIGVGVVLAGIWLTPAQPDAADVLVRLSRTGTRRRTIPSQQISNPDDVQEKLGLLALRLLPDSAWTNTPTKELAILRRTVASYYGEKMMFALVPLIAVPLITAILSITTPVPFTVPLIASMAIAVGLWFLPNYNVRDDAKIAREDFNRELVVYVELVAMERANGSGQREAMEVAAQAGNTWVFQRIGQELARSRWAGEAPWDALHTLSEDLGLPKLDELADIMRLSGEEGAQVYKTLRAHSAALRDALLKAELTKANEASERLSMPMTGLGIIFMLIAIVPALMRLI